MHRLIRNTHLALGVLFTLVWMMYGISSVQMSHPEWFPAEPAVSHEEVPVDAGTGAVEADVAARTIAQDLARYADMHGDVENVRAADDTLTFRIVRPGTIHQVVYLQGSQTASVTSSVGGFIAMLNRLHHYAGFWRGWLPLDLWGVLVSLASVGLILLGATGIYLWFRTYGERVVGGSILAVGTAVGLALIVLLRTAG